ncbi:MAG: hypothetical protein AB8E15_04775 [Bdellovibrionales bacterium]
MKSYFLVGSLMFLSGIRSVEAYPARWNSCNEDVLQIKSSELLIDTQVFFDKDCRTAFVAPPNRGNVVSSAEDILFPITMEYTCGQIEVLGKSLSAAHDELYALSKYSKSLTESKTQKLELHDLNLNFMKNLLNEKRAIRTYASELKAKQRLTSSQLNDVEQRLLNCESSIVCSELRESKKNYTSSIKGLNKLIKSSELEIKSLDRDYNASSRENQRLLKEVQEINVDIGGANQSIQTRMALVETKMGSYKMNVGFSTKISLDTDWDKIISGLSREFSGLGIQFERLPIKDSNFLMTDITQGSQTKLDMLIGVRKPTPVFTWNGNTRDPQIPTGMSPIYLGSSILQFNEIALCSIYDLKKSQIIPGAEKKLQNFMAAQSVYSYPVLENSDYSIDFNFHKVVDKILERLKSSRTISISKRGTDSFLWIEDFRILSAEGSIPPEQINLRRFEILSSIIEQFAPVQSVELINGQSMIVFKTELNTNEMQKKANDLKAQQVERKRIDFNGATFVYDKGTISF